MTAGCAGPKAVSVAPTQVFELTSLSAPESEIVKVEEAFEGPEPVDGTPEGAVYVKAWAFKPTPRIAVQRALQEVATSSKTSPAVEALLTQGTIKLKSFEVQITPFNVADVPSRQVAPGAALFDSGLRNLARGLAGGSFVQVKLNVEISGRTCYGVGIGKYTASPGAWSTRRPFHEAITYAVTYFGAEVDAADRK